MIWAFAGSLVLHAAVLLPLHWPFGAGDPPAGQIYLQANLQPRSGNENSKREKAGDRKQRERAANRRSDGKASRLTTPGTLPSVAASAPEAPAQTESPADEAHRLDMPQPPDYPIEALQRKLEGCVLALVSVSSSGDVATVKILESDHPGVFDQSVIDSQKDARYLPARRGDENVESQVLAVAAFVLDPARRLNCALKYAPIAEKLLRRSAP